MNRILGTFRTTLYNWGETGEEVLPEAAKHVKEVHGYTDERLNDPKFLVGVKKLMRTA